MDVAEPTREQLHRIAAWGPVFDAPDFSFGEWVPSQRQPDGTYTMPWFRFSAQALEFIRSLVFSPDFNWPEWARTPEAQAFNDPAAIATATPVELVKLVTALVRSDRFSEGALAEVYERGLLRGVIRRAAALADASPTLAEAPSMLADAPEDAAG